MSEFRVGYRTTILGDDDIVLQKKVWWGWSTMLRWDLSFDITGKHYKKAKLEVMEEAKKLEDKGHIVWNKNL